MFLSCRRRRELFATSPAARRVLDAARAGRDRATGAPIAVGAERDYHACAPFTRTERVFCWGDGGERDPPLRVPSAASRSRGGSAAGGFQTRALSRDGGPYCWGGSGVPGSRRQRCAPCGRRRACPACRNSACWPPVYWVTCGVTVSASFDVVCWDDDDDRITYGGGASPAENGAACPGRPAPSVSVSRDPHTCAITTGGRLLCWGRALAAARSATGIVARDTAADRRAAAGRQSGGGSRRSGVAPPNPLRRHPAMAMRTAGAITGSRTVRGTARPDGEFRAHPVPERVGGSEHKWQAGRCGRYRQRGFLGGDHSQPAACSAEGATVCADGAARAQGWIDVPGQCRIVCMPPAPVGRRRRHPVHRWWTAAVVVSRARCERCAATGRGFNRCGVSSVWVRGVEGGRAARPVHCPGLPSPGLPGSAAPAQAARPAVSSTRPAPPDQCLASPGSPSGNAWSGMPRSTDDAGRGVVAGAVIADPWAHRLGFDPGVKRVPRRSVQRKGLCQNGPRHGWGTARSAAKVRLHWTEIYLNTPADGGTAVVIIGTRAGPYTHSRLPDMTCRLRIRRRFHAKDVPIAAGEASTLPHAFPLHRCRHGDTRARGARRVPPARRNCAAQAAARVITR